MTPRNISAGFKVCGVFPFNRDVVLDKLPKEEFTSFNPESVAQSSGLAYIPLYSPAPSRKSTRAELTKPQDKVTAVAQLDYSSCGDTSASSDIELGDSCLLLAPVQPVRALSKFLRTPVPPSKHPTKNGKSCGKVLTSLEDMQIMEAREAAKQEKARLKEERKKAREEKARKKASNSGEDVQTCIFLLIKSLVC